MKPCLLCLEINKDTLDCILWNTTQWRELDIEKTIAKHFWSLNTTHSGSLLCLSCWREVESFHKFYLRIEEAHTNFGEIKIEDPDLHKANAEFCFLEPEIQIDQEHQWNFEEPENITEHSRRHEVIVDKNAEKDMNIDELYKNDVLLKVASSLECEDPLEKSRKHRKKKSCKTKTTKEKKSTKVKRMASVLNNINERTDNCDDVSNVNDKLHKDGIVATMGKRRGKHHPNRKENDKFISEHLQQMTCDLCKVRLEDFRDMLKHFSETHKQRGYILCCKRKFSDRTRLVDHLHCHLNPDHFKCGECGKTMSDRVKFDNHMLRVHRANEVVKQHCCDVCGKSFREAYVLRTHKLTHLPEEEKKFPCSDCGKNYGSSYLLNQHRQVVHLKRFVKVCYICGKEINSSAEFKVHMNKHEGIPPPVIHCDVCGLRLTSERGLKVHKEFQHPVGGKQEHPCAFCDKISPTARALKKHVNTMHEKGYNFKCNMCDKAFRRTESLKEHMASHTGTRLYECPWCPMTFNSNGNMHSHRKNKHPKEYLELKSQNFTFPIVS